jgi:FMN phosphatase YigB (HAD superfamily)
VRAVLFDLDGTLLDIDIDRFLRRYFEHLGPVVARVVEDRITPEEAIDIVMRSTHAMMRPHPGMSNQSAFDLSFVELTGADLADAYCHFTGFYETVFPTLREGLGPATGAVEAVEEALSLGLEVAVATNPIFPEIAIRQRMDWAGLTSLDIPVVTTFESMHACKPSPDYFLETASLLGVSPTECLMVGDDAHLDMPAADVGMSTYYVGTQRSSSATYAGTLVQLPNLLRRLAVRPPESGQERGSL